MSKKAKYIALGCNLAGFLIVGAALGSNFWTGMFGLILVDMSSRILGKHGV